MNKKLEANAVISHYRIVSKIGEGGMGEVFLAEDTKLNRKIALKILPAEFAADKERMRRFVQEAQAAAALNHPHIAHVYEIGETDSTHFIAMEFVDGTTLRDMIHRERTELKRILKYLTQVAEGLAKAHAAGIVHRDLKPENIMISRDGYAKILDFGLAKLVEPATFQPLADNDRDEAETAMLQQHSQPGMILGTMGYMSPEQAQGKIDQIDNRSDIFSFGCILFEAATGHRAFEGDSVVKSLHQIIYEPAPPIKEFNPAAPSDLQRIVRRCLAKDPEERYQTIKDVAIELRELRREIDGGVEFDATVPPNSGETLLTRGSDVALSQPARAVSTEPPVPVTQISSAEYLISEIKRRKGGAVLAFIALALVVAGGFGAYKYYGGPGSTSINGTSFEKTKVTKMTKSGKVIAAAISPDGKYFAHVFSENGQQTVFVRQTAANNDITVVPAGTVEYWGITFTRDSNDLYYVQRATGQPGVLYRIPALGGTPQRLMERLDSPVAFSPDGKKLSFVRSEFPTKDESALIIANSDGTGEQTLSTRKMPDRFSPLYFVGPSWSPDGRSIATAVAAFDAGYNFKVIAVNVGDGKETVLTKQNWGYIGRVEWLSDGKGAVMVARDQSGSYRQLWYLSISDGSARQITNDFVDYRSLSVTADATRLVTAQLDQITAAWVGPLSDMEQVRQIVPPASEGIIGMSWTPGGKLVYFYDGLANTDIWIMDADGSNKKQLTSNAGRNSWPQVSPDGSRIVFTSSRSGTTNVWIMGIDGSNPKQLTDQIRNENATFSPDGNWIVYASYYPETQGLWKVPAEGGSPVRLTEGKFQVPTVSPDGKLIAALYLAHPTAPDQLANQIAVVSIDGGPVIKTFDKGNSPTAGAVIMWSPDGKSILYNQVKDSIANLLGQPIAGGDSKQISNFKDGFIYSFSASRDGKQIAISRGNTARDAIMLSSEK
jgi:serine/threonine protein kinase/Tol biopolymer transport system component